MSDELLGEMMLESSGLSEIQRLMILTSTGNSKKQDAVEEALKKQHGKIHLGSNHGPRQQRWPRWNRQNDKRQAHLANEGEEDGDPDEENFGEEEEDWTPEDHGEEEANLAEGVEDELLAVELETLAEIEETCNLADDETAECCQSQLIAYVAWNSATAKGKSKGKEPRKGKSRRKGKNGKGKFLSLEGQI